MKKETTIQETYDYNNPIHINEFEFLDYSDNGKSKILNFKYDNKYFTQEYKYGKNFGVKFITQYNSEKNLRHPLTQTGGEQIYSSSSQSNCTSFGKYIEYSLSKIDMAKIIDKINQSTHLEVNEGKQKAQWTKDNPEIDVKGSIPIGDYTSGEWWINYKSPWSMVQSGDKVLIYFRYGEQIPDEESKANVRLIASAPQLMAENEALKAANRELLAIAKRCAFLFSNEANYPEGTAGYGLWQSSKEAISKHSNQTT